MLTKDHPLYINEDLFNEGIRKYVWPAYLKRFRQREAAAQSDAIGKRSIDGDGTETISHA